MIVLNVLQYAPLYDHLKLLVNTIGVKNSESASRPAYWQARGVWAHVHAGNSTDKRGEKRTRTRLISFPPSFFWNPTWIRFLKRTRVTWRTCSTQPDPGTFNKVRVSAGACGPTPMNTQKNANRHINMCHWGGVWGRERVVVGVLGGWRGICATHRAVSSRGNRHSSATNTQQSWNCPRQSDLCLLWFSA